MNKINFTLTVIFAILISPVAAEDILGYDQSQEYPQRGHGLYKSHRLNRDVYI